MNLNTDQASKNPHLFYDYKDFKYLEPITKNINTIKSEFISLTENKVDDEWQVSFPQYVLSENKDAWKVFSFNFFSMKFPKNAALCPKTAELIFSIPEIISSNYSYLKAKTHILPHKGYSRMQLRCHLPIVIPDEKLCGIRVENETRHWREGELLIFDDSFEHEAWNNSNKPRVVLMFDIPNPLWGYSAFEISKYKIQNLDDSFLLNLASKEKWIQALHEGISPV